MISYSNWFSLSQNKSFETQLELFDHNNYDLFDLSLAFTRKQDHAGLRFKFSLYYILAFELSIYDNRHWDYENNCYHKSGKDIS